MPIVDVPTVSASSLTHGLPATTLGLKCAPLLIWIVFIQTVSQFVSFKLKWPPALLELFRWTDIFNVDIEVAAVENPRCSAPPQLW